MRCTNLKRRAYTNKTVQIIQEKIAKLFGNSCILLLIEKVFHQILHEKGQATS